MSSSTPSQSSVENSECLFPLGNQPFSTTLLISTTGRWWIRKEGDETFASKYCAPRLIYLEPHHPPISIKLCLQAPGIKDLSQEQYSSIQVIGRTAILSRKLPGRVLASCTTALVAVPNALVPTSQTCQLLKKRQKPLRRGSKVDVNLSHQAVVLSIIIPEE